MPLVKQRQQLYLCSVYMIDDCHVMSLWCCWTRVSNCTPADDSWQHTTNCLFISIVSKYCGCLTFLLLNPLINLTLLRLRLLLLLLFLIIIIIQSTANRRSRWWYRPRLLLLRRSWLLWWHSTHRSQAPRTRWWWWWWRSTTRWRRTNISCNVRTITLCSWSFQAHHC